MSLPKPDLKTLNTNLEKALKQYDALAKPLAAPQKDEQNGLNRGKLGEEIQQLVASMVAQIQTLQKSPELLSENRSTIDKAHELMQRAEETVPEATKKTQTKISPVVEGPKPGATLKKGDMDIELTDKTADSSTYTFKVKDPADIPLAEKAIENVMNKHGIPRGPDGNYEIDSKFDKLVKEIKTEFNDLKKAQTHAPEAPKSPEEKQKTTKEEGTQAPTGPAMKPT